MHSAANRPHPIQPGGEEDAEPGDTQETGPSTLIEWYETVFAPAITRQLQVGGRTWCARWTEHPEAAARLMTLWQSWQIAADADGWMMSTWWVDHVDRHLTVLLDKEAGPFYGCTPNHHSSTPMPGLPVADQG